MHPFVQSDPSLESTWRAIILFGRNVASYKFALGKSLCSLAIEGTTKVTLADLAVPFSNYVTEHLKLEDRQGISRSSKFLDSCRAFNADKVSRDELLESTVRYGFENVIDAFHIVNGTETPKRFFIDERRTTGSIVLTDELFNLRECEQFRNLPLEVESRWRLVETAWSLKLDRQLLAVSYDEAEAELYVQRSQRKQSVTSCRSALNGYQKGKCFYCVGMLDLGLISNASSTEVDHFFPVLLENSPNLMTLNFNGVWNLVLACRRCNGPAGKWARVPSIELLSRLHRRNNYLIDSHHPLRETLMLQTGSTLPERQDFLQSVWTEAKSSLIHEWSPRSASPPAV